MYTKVSSRIFPMNSAPYQNKPSTSSACVHTHRYLETRLNGIPALHYSPQGGKVTPPARLYTYLIPTFNVLKQHPITSWENTQRGLQNTKTYGSISFSSDLVDVKCAHDIYICDFVLVLYLEVNKSDTPTVSLPGWFIQPPFTMPGMHRGTQIRIKPSRPKAAIRVGVDGASVGLLLRGRGREPTGHRHTKLLLAVTNRCRKRKPGIDVEQQLVCFGCRAWVWTDLRRVQNKVRGTAWETYSSTKTAHIVVGIWLPVNIQDHCGQPRIISVSNTFCALADWSGISVPKPILNPR